MDTYLSKAAQRRRLVGSALLPDIMACKCNCVDSAILSGVNSGAPNALSNAVGAMYEIVVHQPGCVSSRKPLGMDVYEYTYCAWPRQPLWSGCR